MRIILALLASAILLHPEAQAGEDQRLIWGNVPIVKSADYAEFNAELARSRAQARRELLGDFASLLIPLAGSTDDVVGLAHVLAATVQRFDELARRHAAEAHQGIGLALQGDFKAGVESIFRDHRLNEPEQRTGFAFASKDDLGTPHRTALPIREALALVRDLRYLAYGSYVLVERGVVRVVLHLEDLHTARVRTFTAQGPIEEVGGRVARRVVDFLQGTEYPAWENPQTHLTWIAPAFPQNRVRAEVAARYCQGQRARLPYTSELVQAALGGPFRAGGIGPLVKDSFYVVADRNRHDEQHFYSTREDAQSQTGGPVLTSAGLGVVTGYYWCVRGEPSRETMLDQALYRLLRAQRERQRTDVVLALEYVIASRHDPGADPEARGVAGQSTAEAFGSLEGALRYLTDNGLHVELN